jgi:hypothetical protein
MGHAVSYPAMFVTAVATMSLSIIAREEALRVVEMQAEPTSGTQGWLIEHVGLSASEAASFEVIMTPVMVGVIAVALLAHLAALPWARAARAAVLEPGEFAGEPKRVRRRYAITVGVALAVVIVAGAVGWGIIFSA